MRSISKPLAANLFRLPSLYISQNAQTSNCTTVGHRLYTMDEDRDTGTKTYELVTFILNKVEEANFQ
jgi:hypothetical protein